MNATQKISLFVIAVTLINSCIRSNTEINKDDTISPRVEKIIWKDYLKITGILSIKYDTRDSLTKEVILDYLRIHSPLEYFELTFYDEKKDTTVFDYILLPKETIAETINKISSSTDLQPQIISSILYDFEIWRKLNEIENEVDDLYFLVD
jgi:hypothetical protein